MLVFLQGWVGTEEPAEPEASGAYISRKEGFVLAAEADKTALFWGDFSHAFWHLQDNWTGDLLVYIFILEYNI